MAQPVWTLPEVRAWMEWAEENQKEIQQKLLGKREYDFFESTDHGKQLLREKVAFAMCGPPRHEDLSHGQEEETKITKVYDLICKHNEGQKSFRVSFLFICCLTRDECFYTPVIRLHLYCKATKDIFVDNVFRSYHGFQDYLVNNRLPKCLICFPANGSYYLAENQQFSVGFRRSAACGDFQKVREKADSSATVAGLGALAVRFGTAIFAPGLTAVITVADGIVLGSAAYSTCRSVEKLHDMRTHGQSIGLGNPEARNCWLTIGTAVGYGASKSAAIAIEKCMPFLLASEISNAAMMVPFNISLSVTGLGVVNGIWNITQKIVEGEPINVMDGICLVSSLFFFSHIYVTCRQATELVREVLARGKSSQNLIADLAVLAEERVSFGKLLNANAAVCLTAIGSYNIRRNTSEDFATCFRRICKYIVEFVKSLKYSDVKEFAKKIKPSSDGYWNSFVTEMEMVGFFFCKVNGEDSMHDFFDKITSDETQTLANDLLLMNDWVKLHVSEDGSALEQSIPQALADVIELQNQAGTVQAKDGTQEWTEEFQRTCDLLKKEFERQKTNYQERFETVKKYLPTLTESEFQEVEGITGPLKEYLWKKALTQMQKDFSSKDSLLKLTKGLSLANPGSSGLEDPETGMKVYFFHGVKPAGNDQHLSSEQIVALASERVGSDLVQSATLEVDVESRLAFFRDLPSNAEGVSCIIVQCVPEDGSVAGHIYVAKGDVN